MVKEQSAYSVHYTFGFVQFYEIRHIITDHTNNRPVKKCGSQDFCQLCIKNKHDMLKYSW